MPQTLTPVKKTIVGVQFLFVAFGATVTMPLLLGIDPSTALLTAGVGTLIFHLVTKGKVPIYLGSNFAFLMPIALVAEDWGMPGVMTGLAGVALVYFFISALVRWKGIAILDRLFPPVVIGPTIMLIGLSLCPSAVDMAKNDWLLAIIALAAAIAVLAWGKGLLGLLPIIAGIAVAYLVAACMGKVNFSPIADAPWFMLPKNITHPQMPAIAWQPLVVMMPIALVSIIEHVGDVYVISQVAEKDFVREPGLHRTILGDGLAVLFGSLIGGPPVTTYSEVTGAIQITRVTDPAVLRITAIAAILLSISGKMNAFLRFIPKGILGGIMLLLFGTIASVGVQSMIRHKVDFSKSRNTIIVSLMLALGIGGVVLTAGKFTLSSIGLCALTGIALNLILPKQEEGTPKAKESAEQGE
ncbi:uracil-xanthine permease [bacterium]|nr:uracil-xanthine permease [bacterium]